MPHPDSIRPERLLLEVLTGRLRTMTLAQAARAFWSGSIGAARAATRRRGEWFAARTLLAQAERPLAEPLAVWQPGLPEPGFGPIAHAAQRRWSSPTQATVFIVATEGAARSTGGSGGRWPRVSEATHDLHLAAVYLLMRDELPSRAESWEGEDAAGDAPGGGGRPDATVRDGFRRTAIELVGQYSPGKLAAFHQRCAARGLGYELW